MRRTSAFTLVELLTIIALVTLLIALLLPALGEARETARRTLCLTQLHQVGVGITSYANDARGSYPTRDVRHPLIIAESGYDSAIPDFDIRADLLRYCSDARLFYCPSSPRASHPSVSTRQPSGPRTFYRLDPVSFVFQINIVLLAGLYTTQPMSTYRWYDGATDLGPMETRRISQVKSGTALAVDWADSIPAIGYGATSEPFRGSHSARGPIEGASRLLADGSSHWRAARDPAFKIRLVRFLPGYDDYYFW